MDSSRRVRKEGKSCVIDYGNGVVCANGAIVRAYIRCSTELQVNDGFSIPTQENTITNYCKNKGLFIIGQYYDLGISGSKGLDERLGLAACLAELRKGESLIVSDQDRLSREIELSIRIRKYLEEKGIGLIMISMDLNVNTTQGSLIYNIHAAVAESERKMISDRVKSGHKYLVENGKLKPRPGFGWTFVGKGKPHERNEKEWEVIEFILNLRNKEHLSYADIIRELDVSYPCADFGRKAWYTQTVKDIINEHTPGLVKRKNPSTIKGLVMKTGLGV